MNEDEIRDGRKLNSNLGGEVWVEDDPILAEIILRNIRNGGNIMDGCREMERETKGKRTAAACKYRWHTVLKEQYKGGYELAKEQGREVKRKKKANTNKGLNYDKIMENILGKESDQMKVTIDDVLSVVQAYKKQEDKGSKKEEELGREVKRLERENSKNLKKVRDKEKELEEIKEQLENTQHALASKQRDYKRVMDALKTFKDLGMQINIPEPEEQKFIINKDGTVETL